MSLNLLPSEAKFQAQRMRIKALIGNFLWVIGGIWVLLILIVFGASFFLNLRLSSLDKKYQARLNDYKSRINEVALTQKIKYQAKIVAKVLDSRFEYGQSISLVNDLFSDNVRIDDIQISKDKVFELSGGSTDGSVIDEVESKVSEINAGMIDGFAGAKILSVGVNEEKGWSFRVELLLK